MEGADLINCHTGRLLESVISEARHTGERTIRLRNGWGAHVRVEYFGFHLLGFFLKLYM